MTEEKKNHTGLPGPMEYDQLLEYGLAYIRQIGSRSWTDFNAHDPGVTILEALTLALNDLSYRSSAAMADLLTRPGGKAPSLEGALFPAEVILPNAPTTPDDYRKLILENIPGVRNVWLREATRTLTIPHIPNKTTSSSTTLHGYYNILVELEGLNTMQDDPAVLAVVGKDIDGKTIADHIDSDNVQALFRHSILSLLRKHRNLGEDFLDVTFLEPIEVGLCAEIEIDSDVDVRSLLQGIYDRMYDYVSPAIPIHGVSELLASGREADEIFSLQKPLLGFIDADELRSFTRKTDLYASDAIGILMGIPGIKAIRHIHFITDKNAHGVTTEYDGRHLSIDPDGSGSFHMTPLFHRNQRVSSELFVNNIIFQRIGLNFFPPAGAKSPEDPDGLSVHPREDEKRPLSASFLSSLPLPAGSYRSSDRYFSFQNLFPASYRMGADTLPNSAKALRKAERMQLKAYLTFFDQTLADYLAQLDRLQDLFSLEGENNTYFHHRILDTDVVDVSQVLRGYPDYPIPPDDEKTDLARKNSLLNHLLSRFADTFAEYTALEFVRKGYEDEFSLRECVEDKKRFLRDYPRISSLRSSGLDWTVPSVQVSGAECRIMRKLGVNDPDARGRLSERNEMGLYLLEHNLLVPWGTKDAFLQLETGTDRKKLLDNPYSFRVTAVLTGWPELAGNLHYRRYVETIIREELPAHLFVKICWVSREVMAELEDAYATWHRTLYENARFKPSYIWQKRHSDAHDRLVEAFGHFANVYQVAVVMPDDTMDYVDDESVTRLDFTYLGSEDYESSPKKVEAQPESEPTQTEEPPKAERTPKGEKTPRTFEPAPVETPVPVEEPAPVETPAPVEEPSPKATGEEVASILDTLYEGGPKTLGSLTEDLRKNKETTKR